MSKFPNCREDETYNQKYLTELGKAEIFGYDWCAEQAVDRFFDNLDTLDEPELEKFMAKELPPESKCEYTWQGSFILFGEEPQEETRRVETYGDLLRLRIIEWIETERNEVITSMIDDMDDEEYRRIKEEQDGEAE